MDVTFPGSIKLKLKFLFLLHFQIDDLRKKLSDFERVNKAQNSLNDHSSNLELEIKKLQQK